MRLKILKFKFKKGFFCTFIFAIQNSTKGHFRFKFLLFDKYFLNIILSCGNIINRTVFGQRKLYMKKKMKRNCEIQKKWRQQFK